MGYERYPRNTNPQGDYYGRNDPQDYGRDYGSGRDYSYSSARDYQATGQQRSGDRDYGRDSYGGGNRDYGSRDYGNQSYGQPRGRGGYGQQQYGQQYGPSRAGRDSEYHGSYGSDGHRFEDVGSRRDWDNDDRFDRDRQRQSYGQQRSGGGNYGRQPQGYDYEERGFFQRAGDEVRSWFGDDDAERRREQDARYDERDYGGRGEQDRDSDYHSWRRTQIDALDRDYGEYRQENRQKFHNDFGAWRGKRQGQRDLVGKITEHMDVVGSDGEHVGTVDKVRGDRVVLTKSDTDAGGRHHSFPSSWLDQVDTKVTLSKTASDAKAHWKDEERNQAMFGERDTNADRGGKQAGDDRGAGMLNKSFSGTY